MVLLFLTSLDRQGQKQRSCLGELDLESAFERLTDRVSQGCQLVSIHLSVDGGRFISLPVEAFDGMPLKEPLIQKRTADPVAAGVGTGFISRIKPSVRINALVKHKGVRIYFNGMRRIL